MTDRLVILGSGSSGNSALLEVAGRGYLIDCGFTPHELTNRLASVQSSWGQIDGVFLTHTHTDHWNRYALEHLRRQNIRLYLHSGHHAVLSAYQAYHPLKRAGLLSDYDSSDVALPAGLRLSVVEVPHDASATFAFRFDRGPVDQPGGWSLGYASDLGIITNEFLALMHGIETLALEFNHDVRMEKSSTRPRMLINRVLSDVGHLSNRQAMEAVELLIESGYLKTLIALHLSRECNTPELVNKTMELTLGDSARGMEFHISLQDRPTPSIPLRPRTEAKAMTQPVRLKRRSLLDFVSSS